MSHELDRSGEKVAFVSVVRTAADVPWHRLGQQVSEAMTAQQAMELGHLDYEVSKQPLFAHTESGLVIPVPDKFATVRTNPFTGMEETLGVVGKDYTVVQNSENAEFLDAVVEQSGAHFETAGAIKGGRQVFLSLKLPESMMIGGVDAVDKYLVAWNSHDGSRPFQIFATAVRPVCANTLRMGNESAVAKFSARHTRGVTSATKAEEAQQVLGVAFDYMSLLEREANAMAGEPMSDAEFDTALEQFFAEEKAKTERQAKARREQVEQVKDIYYTSPNLTDVVGTRWGGYNALTEYVDWAYPVRGTENDRAERIMAGGWVDEKKAAAYRLMKV